MNYLIVFAEDSPESRVATDLLPFFEAVIKEVARHVPEKGYGYRNQNWFDYFKTHGQVLATQYRDNRENPGEALDATAMLAFAWLHETGKMSGVRTK